PHQTCEGNRFLDARHAVALLHLRRSEIPVRQIPERLDILRPRIAVVDVISMFPDVAGQQRAVGAGDRRGRIRSAHDTERAVRALYQPGPARAERARGELAEIVLELREAAERLLD